MNNELEEEFFLGLGEIQLQVSSGAVGRQRAIELLGELLDGASVRAATFEEQLECRRRVVDCQLVLASEAGLNAEASRLFTRRLELGFDTLARQAQFFLLAATVVAPVGLGREIGRHLRITRAALVADAGNEAGWDYAGMIGALNERIESWT